MIKAIAAIGTGHAAIGLNGKLPWKCKEDMVEFRKRTRDLVLLCGSKTYEDMKPIDGTNGRSLIRITRNPVDEKDRTLEEAVEEFPDAMICGGREIYIAAMPYIEEFILNTIEYCGPYDTVFPMEEFLKENWSVGMMMTLPDSGMLKSVSSYFKKKNVNDLDKFLKDDSGFDIK